jgi:radical SAM superfamily enzyme YgiQ (UPF0313 family)
MLKENTFYSEEKAQGNDITLIGYEDEENLGLRSIAAFLETQGIKTTIIPFEESSKKRILQTIRQSNPSLVGFSLIFQRMLMDFAYLAKYLRNHGVTSHFTIGGHFPTIEYAKTLETIPELDTVVRHEGEHTLLELYRHLEAREYWSKIKGIAFLSNDNIVVTPPRPLITDLDELPFPVRRFKTQTFRGLGLCSILASRGCFYNCSFCSVRQFYGGAPGLRRRARSPPNVTQEMKQLFKKGIRIFKFNDDHLGMKTKVQREWINEFVHELTRSGLAEQILWRISNRIDELDVDCLRAMKEVGLTFLYIGIESGNKEGLQTCNKNYTIDDVYKGIEILDKVDLHFDYGFMMLTPDSTLRTIEEDLQFLTKLTQNSRVIVHFTKMFPYVGTPIAERLKKEQRLEGTIDFPNYRFRDPKLNLLESFIIKSFHDAMFRTDGVVNKLRMRIFDVEVLHRFFFRRYDIEDYEDSLNNLITRYNKSALETIGLSLRFVKKYDYKDILTHWDAMEYLTQQELEVQSRISATIDTLAPQEL